MFTGVDFWPHKKIFPVMDVRRTFVSITVGMFLASIAILAIHGLNFGIDFKGGSLFEIQAKSQDGKPGVLDIGDLRQKVGALGLGDVQIQQLDKASDALRTAFQHFEADTAAGREIAALGQELGLADAEATQTQ